jgi:sterol-4alpha-carboxylate 3-dehydrogenase (decarboxylating)
MRDEIRVALTGGYGFVGRHVISALKEQLPQASIYVLDKTIPEDVPADVTSMVAESFQVDITTGNIKEIFSQIKPDAVVHTAGINPPLAERYLRRIEQLVLAVNVGGTANVISAAKHSGCRALVYTSSCCAVTDDLYGSFANIDERWPVSRKSTMYGESKVQAEALVLAADSKDMATCVLRPSVIFGEGDPILGTRDCSLMPRR